MSKRKNTASAEGVAQAHQKQVSESAIESSLLDGQERIGAYFMDTARSVLIEAMNPDPEIVISNPITCNIIEPKALSHEDLAGQDAGIDSQWILNINPATFNETDSERIVRHFNIVEHEGSPVHALLDHIANQFPSARFPGMKSVIHSLVTHQHAVRSFLQTKEPGHGLIFSGVTFRALGDWHVLCLFINEQNELVAGNIGLNEKVDSTMSIAWFERTPIGRNETVTRS